MCEPNIDSIQRTVFHARCSDAACHGAAEPSAGLDLQSPGVAERLVDQRAATCGRTLVTGDYAEQSFLYEKLASSTPECGERMPVFSSIADHDIACIRDWIAALPLGCDTCGGAGCADLQIDSRNCGGCDIACPTGATCAAGACMCGNTEVECTNACADLTSNPAHCGQCENACGGMLVCSLSTCKPTCDTGLTNCSSACVSTATDPNHCGGCGIDCGPTATCVGGQCNCGMGIDSQTDRYNCGTCGNVCPPGQDCVLGVCECGSATVSFSATVEPILVASCAILGCHRAPAPKESLDLSAGIAHSEIVNVLATQCSSDARRRVQPGDPSKSYLVDKILGVDLCFGGGMPRTGSLSPAEVEAISSWICAGAPDN